MTFLRPILAAALIATPLPAFAEDAPPPPPRDRMAMLIIFGDDPCPRSGDDEIIVCSREPESERYRIPEKLRKPKKQRAVDRSWGDRVRTLEMTSAMGRPNSCSPVGSNGQTGCIDRFLKEWREERKNGDEAEVTTP